jgi:phage-related protein
LLYVARFAEAIVVLHVFQKRTRQTSGIDAEVARRRLRGFIRQRSQ